MIKRIVKQKKKGFAVMLISMFFVFFMIMFLCLGLYIRAAEILSENIRNDADSATMSAAVINADEYRSNRKFQIIGSADASSITVSDEERAEVYDRLHKYLSSLTTTMGITSTGFSGGNVGWAANQLNVRDFTIDDFYIYDYVGTTLVEYKVSNINMTQIVNGAEHKDFSSISIQKRTSTSGTLSGSPFSTHRRSDLHLPTVYAVFSFDLDLPKAFTSLSDEVLSRRVQIKSFSQIEPAS